MERKKQELIAKAISYTVHPFWISILVSFILIQYYQLNFFEYALVLSPAAVLVMGYIIVVVFLIKSSDLEFTDVKKRPPLMILAATGVFISVILGRFFLPEIEPFLVRLLIAIVILTSISFYWKVSIHGFFTALAITMLVKYLALSYIFLSALLPLVYWSRIVLKKHELSQLIVGSIISFVVFLA